MAKTQVTERTVTAKKYADLIFPDDKQAKAAEKQEAIEDAELAIHNAIASAKKNVRTAQKAYDYSRRCVPLNPLSVLSTKYDLAEAEGTLSDLEELSKELF